MAMFSDMETVKEGDIVRTTKYAQPLEVIKVYPPIRQAETIPQGAPRTAKPQQHDYSELKPYVRE